MAVEPKRAPSRDSLAWFKCSASNEAALITPPLGVADALGDGVLEVTVVVGAKLLDVDVGLELVVVGVVFVEVVGVEVWLGVVCALAVCVWCVAAVAAALAPDACVT